MGEITKEEIRDRMGNIELIRDIIFGSKLHEYDSRIDKLEANLSSLEKEMRDRTEQIKSLSLTSQKDNADIRQLIDRTYKNFAGSLDSIDKTLATQTNSIRREL